MEYKKIAIKAMDVKPGDILTGRIETNRWPNQMTVKEVTLTDQVIHIKTTSGMVYHFASLHTFLKTISPAEEAETAEPISTGYEAEIEKLDLDITEYAVVILGNLEPHINTLKELEDGNNIVLLVFQRRASQCPSAVSAQGLDGFSGVRLWILNTLGLVDDDKIV